jgi:hypothetical protein
MALRRLMLLVPVVATVTLLFLRDDGDGQANHREGKRLCESQHLDARLALTALTRRRNWGLDATTLSEVNKWFNTEMARHRELPPSSYNRTDDGITRTHSRFDLLGPVTPVCPPKHRIIFGHGDEAKEVCYIDSESCVVFSIGSHNVYDFESEIVAKTNCNVEVFDCTVPGRVPAALAGRVRYHEVCLGNAKKTNPKGWQFERYVDLVHRAGNRPTYLKMDIEASEWEALVDIISVTADQDLPHQIAVEIHYATWAEQFDWRRRLKQPTELMLLSQLMFHSGGYVLASRHDNVRCAECSEVVFHKVLCSG